MLILKHKIFLKFFFNFSRINLIRFSISRMWFSDENEYEIDTEVYNLNNFLSIDKGIEDYDYEISKFRGIRI